MELQGRQLKPLAWCDDGQLLVYGNGSLRLIGSNEERWLCGLPLAGIRKRLKGSRLASRVLRIEPRTAICIGEDVLVTWDGSVLKVSTKTGYFDKIQEPRPGFSDSLYFEKGQGSIKAVWGDYGANTQHEAINIYALNNADEARIVYTFPEGAIRHIHGIIKRKLGGYYIFTGDFEPTAGIYIADEDFSIVKPLALGEQCFRAVRGFSLEDGLIYATDSASIENHIYKLTEGDEIGDFSLDDLCIMNGPCIYGAPYMDGYLFTTTVEPDESKRGLLSFLSTGLGPGVKTPNSCCVFVDSRCFVSELFRLPSDRLPLKLFQYGSLQLPSGKAPGNNTYAFARALSCLDGRVVKIDAMSHQALSPSR